MLYKSPGQFVGYFKEPQKTAETMTPDGYVKTGDAGFFDANGHLKIIDRANDVGKLADGSLFAPKYIENKLKFFPNIKEAVAFGPDRPFATAFINIDLTAVVELGRAQQHRLCELPGTGRPPAGLRDASPRNVDEVNQLARRRARDGRRADQALPDPAQGARRRRRRADPHPEGAPRLHRRALRRR